MIDTGIGASQRNGVTAAEKYPSVSYPIDEAAVEADHKKAVSNAGVIDGIVTLSKHLKMFDAVKDSGVRQDFQTGSKRDTRNGKGRFDLIPTYPLRRLAKHYENGSAKYGDRNWEKGQPLSRYLDSCMRHLVAVLEGLTDEDHASAVSWNMFAYVATCQWIEEGRLPAELDDLGHTSKGKLVLDSK